MAGLDSHEFAPTKTAKLNDSNKYLGPLSMYMQNTNLTLVIIA